MDFKLYLVADISLADSPEDYIWKVEEAIKGGVTLVQLRAKELTTKEMLKLGKLLKDVLDKYNIPLIVNDRVDVAFALDAHGVHLGEDDLPPKIARKILGENKIIGYSCDDPKKASILEKEGIVDYLGTGSVFSTKTKKDAGEVIGIDGLKNVTKSTSLPVVAIGGINLENVEFLENTGIKGIAVASAIMKSKNPKDTAQIFRKILNRFIP